MLVVIDKKCRLCFVPKAQFIIAQRYQLWGKPKHRLALKERLTNLVIEFVEKTGAFIILRCSFRAYISSNNIPRAGSLG